MKKKPKKGQPVVPPPPPIPPSVVIRQIEHGVAFRVLPEVATARPPVSVFGGPVLGVVLSSPARGNDGMCRAHTTRRLCLYLCARACWWWRC